MTKNLGLSPRGGVAKCLLFSVADGPFTPKIERFEGLCPVVDAPFATLATSSTGGAAALTSGYWLGSLRDPRADCDQDGITL
jgi:hypothetical protein